MFHKSIDLKLLEGTSLEVSFQDGVVKRYDMRVLFSKYPQLKQLEDRSLFLSGKMMGVRTLISRQKRSMKTAKLFFMKNRSLIKSQHMPLPQLVQLQVFLKSSWRNCLGLISLTFLK